MFPSQKQTVTHTILVFSGTSSNSLDWRLLFNHTLLRNSFNLYKVSWRRNTWYRYVFANHQRHWGDIRMAVSVHQSHFRGFRTFAFCHALMNSQSFLTADLLSSSVHLQTNLGLELNLNGDVIIRLAGPKYWSRSTEFTLFPGLWYFNSLCGLAGKLVMKQIKFW